ncbi:MAG: TSUP family transporter [Deltaproteobacteria bacterium]|nr:TSUP family transporter [Deltaproteobacteria bacterium]
MSLLLVPIVALAFGVEAALGFGSTVVAVSLGALLVDVCVLLPAFVPLNMLLSASIVLRDRAHVDARMLLRRVLPAMGLGLPVGLLAFASLDSSTLRGVLGAVVVVLALRELLGLGRRAGEWARHAALFAGGVVHGALGSGGPLVIWALGDRTAEPRALRATLSALWLALNAVLLLGYAWDGRLDATSATWSIWLAGGGLVGAVIGEVVHRRVDAGRFARAVWLALALVGVLLLVR